MKVGCRYCPRDASVFVRMGPGSPAALVPECSRCDGLPKSDREAAAERVALDAGREEWVCQEVLLS